MPSRNTADLCPATKSALVRLTGKAAELGITLKVICTYRSNEEQAKLYAQGRTMPGAIVTKAAAGLSPHNRTFDGKPASRAFDVMLYVGKRFVTTRSDSDMEIWNKVGSLAADFGLQWGGNFTGSFKDYAHFQLVNWRNYA